MGKPFLTVRFGKPAAAKPAPQPAPKPSKPAPNAAAPKPMPKPLPKPAKPAANAAAASAIDRANRAQAMETKENRLMGAGSRKAPQVISTTVRERTTPPKKRG